MKIIKLTLFQNYHATKDVWVAAEHISYFYKALGAEGVTGLWVRGRKIDVTETPKQILELIAQTQPIYSPWDK